MARYIFITGGVISSLGKGLASASLGALLKARGFRVRLRKLDPYLNIDPGTMSPYQHGEVYVTDDGTETDLDLGHYERFTEVPTTSFDYTTTGKIYQNVLNQERLGEFLGATVQVIPHITDAIKNFIQNDAIEDDFIICEIGGTVGDIESLPFLEAARQMRQEKGPAKVLFMHVSLVPYIHTAGELKTKPTQHSVKELQHLGIQPDILLCRCDRPLPSDHHKKLSLFCNLALEDVIEARDVDTIYEAPLTYHAAGLDTRVCHHFGIKTKPVDLTRWRDLVARIQSPEGEIQIGIVGKYTSFPDAYKSLLEALTHAGAHLHQRVHIAWIDAETLEDPEPGDKTASALSHLHAIIIPGGFGSRGIAGKMEAIRFARTHQIPILGICLGLQLMVLETAHNLTALKDPYSSEFDVGHTPVVGLLNEWMKDGALHTYDADKGLGGTMRVGAYPCYMAKGSRAFQIYGQEKIMERHRHRYEVNMAYHDRLTEAGLHFSGLSPDGVLPEIVERPDHPFFIGVQFHPELTSRPFHPHPLFVALLSAALKQPQP